MSVLKRGSSANCRKVPVRQVSDRPTRGGAPYQTFPAPRRPAQSAPGTSSPSLLRRAGRAPSSASHQEATQRTPWPQAPATRNETACLPVAKQTARACACSAILRAMMLPQVFQKSVQWVIFCRASHVLLVWQAHRHTAVIVFTCGMSFSSHSAKCCASAGGRLPRRRRNSAYMRAVAGANLLTSRQAVWVLVLPHTSRGALLGTSTESGEHAAAAVAMADKCFLLLLVCSFPAAPWCTSGARKPVRTLRASGPPAGAETPFKCQKTRK